MLGSLQKALHPWLGMCPTLVRGCLLVAAQVALDKLGLLLVPAQHQIVTLCFVVSPLGWAGL